MTEQPHVESSEDLEYDLAHESVGEQGGSRDAAGEHELPVMPVDDGGDYSYDLAHDVPGR